jgi:hypothetical protein
MLKISQRQMDLFEAQAREAFIARAISHCQSLDPARFGVMPAAGQRQMVEDTIAVAHSLKLRSQAATIALLEIRCAFGNRFPVEPEYEWARNLLSAELADERRTLEYVRDTAFEKAGWKRA